MLAPHRPGHQGAVRDRFLSDCTEPAIHDAGSASGALFQIYTGNMFLFPDDRARRAVPVAKAAHLTLVFHDHEIDEISAHQGVAVLVSDMRVVLVPEVANRREDRVGRALAQPAMGRIVDVVS